MPAEVMTDPHTICPPFSNGPRRVNPELEVTGVLCYLAGVYMQYLEGEESKVDALFKSIRTDKRHGSVTLLERRAISKRVFPEWSMALLEWDDNTRGIFRSFSPEAQFDFYAADPSTAAPMLRALVRAPGGSSFDQGVMASTASSVPVDPIRHELGGR